MDLILVVFLHQPTRKPVDKNEACCTRFKDAARSCGEDIRQMLSDIKGFTEKIRKRSIA